MDGIQAVAAKALGLRDLADARLRWPGTIEPTDATKRAFLFFEAAHRLEAAGQFDQAFDLYAEGNRIKRDEVDAERHLAAHLSELARWRAIFTPDFLSAHSIRNRDTSPIFIVGLARSGSSLVEQILASHPNVQGMGELDSLGRVIRTNYPGDPLGPFDLTAMAADYLGHARASGWKGRRRFTDKRLPSYAAIGLIHLMFPRATILHCVRGAAATCFSAYRLLFGNDADGRFTYDLRDLGRHYVAYRQMIDHWTSILMGRVVTVDHEALIADPTHEIGRLLDTCRLPWDDRCLRFYENDRVVRTMSADQVRRPIFTDSIGRWRNYERHLGPLFEALGPYAPR